VNRGSEAGRIRIIVADDHQEVRHVLCRLLSRLPDLEVVGAAASGEEAISMALLHDPNVVVMDAGMPGMGGIEATRRLKFRLPHVRVIGHSSCDVGDVMIDAGASDFVEKGSPPQRLVDAVRGTVTAPVPVPQAS
jgi:two-component system invasion response regulator UvrY